MKGMRKYYFFVIGLGAVVLAIAVAVLQYDNPYRHDRVLFKSVVAAETAVQSYVSANQQRGIPADLTAVYVKRIPQNISYTKVSDKVFAICATFKNDQNASGTYDAYSDYTDTLYKSAQTYMSTQRLANPHSTYWFVGQYMSDYNPHYKAGDNCFVSQPIADDTTTGRKYETYPSPILQD